MKVKSTNKLQKWILIAGIVFAMFSVIIGAFSAHALKAVLSEYALSLFEKAARYQMYHGLALLGCGLLSALVNEHLTKIRFWISLSASCFIFGTFSFCGSLYILALSGSKWVVLFTPLGGLGFIFGWIFMLVAVLKITNPGQSELDSQLAIKSKLNEKQY